MFLNVGSLHGNDGTIDQQYTYYTSGTVQCEGYPEFIETSFTQCSTKPPNSTGQFIQIDQLCNGEQDCNDKSDESDEQCKGQNTTNTIIILDFIFIYVLVGYVAYIYAKKTHQPVDMEYEEEEDIVGAIHSMTNTIHEAVLNPFPYLKIKH